MSRKTGLSAFWKEVERRRVVRSGGFYVVAAFVLLQLGEIILPAFDAPNWVMQSLVVVLLLGLPVVLACAWVYDLTPHGLERTSDQGVTRVTLAPRVALLVVTLVVAGGGALWFQRNARAGGDGAAPVPAGPDAEMLAIADIDTTVTAIAVLPLADLTGGEDLFARQLHEEIITLLSELTTLRVVSRTSVERYRTTDRLLPEIAAELGVQRIVTGSVAMAAGSDSVRISVQLLDAPTDTHLRSMTYQREMKDILRLQTEVAVDIARTVVGELEALPVPQQFAQIDPEAYRLTLQGRQALEAERWDEALALFDQAVEADSSFALPSVLWFGAVYGARMEGRTIPDDSIAMAVTHLQRARELGGVEEEVAAAEVVAGQAGPRLGWGAGLLAQGGDVDAEAADGPGLDADSLRRRTLLEGTRIGRQFGEPSPLRRAYRYREQGQYDSASVILRTELADNPRMNRAWAALEDLHLEQRDYEAAVGIREEWIRATQGDAAAAENAIEALHATFDEGDPRTYWEWRHNHLAVRQERGDSVSQVELATVAMHLGDRVGAFDHLDAAVETRDPGLAFLSTNPVWDPVRRHPRFRQVREQIEEQMQQWRESRGGRGRGPGPGREGARRPNNPG
ncbi:MAG: hypothetical protein OXF01_16545 [Gemmatimonadetes bacterium]|nr:hypothetical protein [Gemmatimonadota bacterium]